MLPVVRLEDDEVLQDLVLSVFHATTHTFSGTGAAKVVENHTGRAFIKHHSVPTMPPIQLDIAPPVPSGTTPAQNLDLQLRASGGH